MDKEKKTTLEIFKAKATAALKRKREHRTFTISFPSFAQDMDEDGSEGTPLEIKFKTLSDAEINECVAYEDEDDPTAVELPNSAKTTKPFSCIAKVYNFRY